MTFPERTLSAGPFAADAEALLELLGDPLSFSKVPVSSSFFPTCGVSAAAFATSRYIWPGEPAAPGAAVPPGASGAAPAPAAAASEPAGEAFALVNTNFAMGSVASVAPPAAPAVPVVPAVAPGAFVAGSPAEGAACRHPVTVICLSAPSVLFCAGGLVCWAGEPVCPDIATLKAPMSVPHATVQIVVFIVPPNPSLPATIRPPRTLSFREHEATVPAQQYACNSQLMRCVTDTLNVAISFRLSALSPIL
jgi:hypothetical protein